MKSWGFRALCLVGSQNLLHVKTMNGQAWCAAMSGAFESQIGWTLNELFGGSSSACSHVRCSCTDMVWCLLYALTFGIRLAGVFLERNLNVDLVRRAVVGHSISDMVCLQMWYRRLPSVFSALVPRFHFPVLKNPVSHSITAHGDWDLW